MSDGCRFIAGDPSAVITEGESIYCNRRIQRPGEAWCEHHRARVYPPGAKWGDVVVNPAGDLSRIAA